MYDSDVTDMVLPYIDEVVSHDQDRSVSVSPRIAPSMEGQFSLDNLEKAMLKLSTEM